jgi:hypothetical protein
MSTAAQHSYQENPRFELAGIVEKIEASEMQMNAESAITIPGVVFGKNNTGLYRVTCELEPNPVCSEKHRTLGRRKSPHSPHRGRTSALKPLGPHETAAGE